MRQTKMAITNINTFLRDYFQLNECPILQEQNGVLTVQLTEKMDKRLMNRPFYWQYVKSIGKHGEPMKLTLITNPVNRHSKGEWVHFGSPRYVQILNHLKEEHRFTKLYQRDFVQEEKTELHPWLILNQKISYIGRQKRDELFSLGLNLINGQMKTNMMTFLDALTLQPSIPDFSYTISPLIKLKSGYLRVQSVLYDYVTQQKHPWAVEARAKMEEDVDLAKHFFHDEADHAQLDKEISEIRNRYEPRICIQTINGGLFYLKRQQPPNQQN